MKKLFLVAVALTVTLVANAQASIQVGYLSNTLKTENKEVGKMAGKYRGMMAVVDYNLHLTEFLGVAPGLGLEYSFNNQSGSRYKELGICAPVDVNFCLSVSDAFSLSIFAGPTFYYGLFSKETYENLTYDYFKEDSKRFDMCLGGGVWMDFMEDIRVKIGYKFGVINISKLAGIKERNNSLCISIGYVF